MGAQDRVDPLRGQGGDDTVVEDAGGVHDGGERVLGRDGGERWASCSASAVSQAATVTVAPEPGQLAGQFGGAGGVRAARPVSSRCRTPWAVTRCRASRRAEGAGAAGDQDRAVRVDAQVGRARRRPG